MIENGMRYLRGYVKIQIQGYSPERFLNLCSYHHILIWGLAYEDHCYELCMSVRDFKRIRPFAKKTHTKVRVKEKYGFPFSLYNNRKRKLFFAGFIICIFLFSIVCSAFLNRTVNKIAVNVTASRSAAGSAR